VSDDFTVFRPPTFDYDVLRKQNTCDVTPVHNAYKYYLMIISQGVRNRGRMGGARPIDLATDKY